MKKILSILLAILMVTTLVACNGQKPLPLPTTSEGVRGELGIDININEATIDDYLNRSDSVYRDMRMLVDEANFEAIGGDSYLSGLVKGFEVVPYPYLCNVEGLPDAVGSSYTGVTLFSLIDGTYLQNYEESLDILEELFPKDKNIFLMCGGGGYAGMTKSLLVALGWDENKIYNAGGYWYYDGKNKVSIKEEKDGEATYNFDLITYHDIDFDTLTKLRDSGSEANKEKPIIDDNFIEIENTKQLNELIKQKGTFALFVYLPSCTSCLEFMPIVSEFAKSNQIDMYAVKLSSIYNESNPVSDRLEFTPSMFIFVDGEVVAYLDPGSDEDLPFYKTLEGLTTWFSYYVDVEILKSDSYNDGPDCNSGCSILD